MYQIYCLILDEKSTLRMKDHFKLYRDALIDNIDPLEMKSFFEKVTSLLSGEEDGPSIAMLPDDFPILPGECCYITDYKAKRLLFKKGFKELLGFEDTAVDFDFVFKGYHHEDAVIVSQIIKAVIASAVNSFRKDPDMQLSMTYRRKRKDGSYIHLLSQSSVYELDQRGQLVKSFTRLTDVSYLNISTPVSWSVRSSNIDEHFIQSKISGILKNPFTKREIEIIKEIQAGGSNHEIADRLHLSYHTIATHRKNIFKKCDCTSVLDLLLYSKQLKII